MLPPHVRLRPRLLDGPRRLLFGCLLGTLLLLSVPLDASAQYREAPRFRPVSVLPGPSLSAAPTAPTAPDTALVPLSDSALGIASRRRHMWIGALIGYVAAGIHYSIDAERNGEMAASITNVVVMPSAVLLGVLGGFVVHDVRLARARDRAGSKAQTMSPPVSPSPTPEDPANAQR